MTTKISKKEVIKKQIETALYLYFHEQDMIPIHTLVCAAHEILRGICIKRGIESFMVDELIKVIKPEKVRNAKKMVNKDKNFFKHLQNPNRTLKFNSEVTEFWLWDICLMYEKLYNEKHKDMEIFVVWFKANNPNLIEFPRKKEISLKWQKQFPSKLQYYNTIKNLV